MKLWHLIAAILIAVPAVYVRLDPLYTLIAALAALAWLLWQPAVH